MQGRRREEMAPAPVSRGRDDVGGARNGGAQPSVVRRLRQQVVGQRLRGVRVEEDLAVAVHDRQADVRRQHGIPHGQQARGDGRHERLPQAGGGDRQRGAGAARRERADRLDVERGPLASPAVAADRPQAIVADRAEVVASRDRQEAVGRGTCAGIGRRRPPARDLVAVLGRPAHRREVRIVERADRERRAADRGRPEERQHVRARAARSLAERAAVELGGLAPQPVDLDLQVAPCGRGDRRERRVGPRRERAGDGHRQRGRAERQEREARAHAERPHVRPAHRVTRAQEQHLDERQRQQHGGGHGPEPRHRFRGAVQGLAAAPVLGRDPAEEQARAPGLAVRRGCCRPVRQPDRAAREHVVARVDADGRQRGRGPQPRRRERRTVARRQAVEAVAGERLVALLRRDRAAVVRHEQQVERLAPQRDVGQHLPQGHAVARDLGTGRDRPHGHGQLLALARDRTGEAGVGPGSPAQRALGQGQEARVARVDAFLQTPHHRAVAEDGRPDDERGHHERPGAPGPP